MIEVKSNGALNLVVDAGRMECMPMGVSIGGPLDALSCRLANIMVGNTQDAAAIEIGIFPFRVEFQIDALIAVTGAPGAAKVGSRSLAPYWCRWVSAGDTLSIEPPAKGGRTYIGVAGGIAVSEVLGSRSTDLRAGIGGMNGRGLKRGDVLPVGKSLNSPNRGSHGNGTDFGIAPQAVKNLFSELSGNTVQLRCVAAAEHKDFSYEATQRFMHEPYTVRPESNRMGYRLEGERLDLVVQRELFSHGIVPGTVQVPPSGQPIIQLADANTCGGYPKIATVIEADLWKLGQVCAGMHLHFKMLGEDDALAALRDDHMEVLSLRRDIELMAGRF
ncbi:biotin-dependent carboxyltransferase family protein [Paraburkholderia sabiae]|uniref:Biotin-dependent carboxyltransferase family protein n=1 Tax=Paraburkholderia sabiae TaxID=273251 RepID=A0ABU9QLI5_9BURK|nr:biotin-dependent carboxyltransferase family protein [Paraburkholderia sabiae]WJZ79256.1 biotin-dependent carboxyltransferase family protein [Paraburkholderia sabiae]CAD6560752.1 5-oxoprolinase subunit C [Paraburkholderia sabiae]